MFCLPSGYQSSAKGQIKMWDGFSKGRKITLMFAASFGFYVSTFI